MQRVRLKNNLPTTEETNKVVRDGIVHTQTGLFNYCEVAKDRLDKLTRVTTAIEDKLLSEETLTQIKLLPWQQQFAVYDALNKIIGDTTNFLHKMHNVMTDGAKTDYLKKLLIEWLNALLAESNLNEMVFSKFKVKINGNKLAGEAFGEKISVGGLKMGREAEFMSKIKGRPIVFKEELETYESLTKNSRWAVKVLAERAKNESHES